jgi:ribosomal protein S4
LNGNLVDIPSIQVKPGDKIELKDQSTHWTFFCQKGRAKSFREGRISKLQVVVYNGIGYEKWGYTRAPLFG